MVWKPQRTLQSVSVDATVELDEFSEEQLLQALIDSRWISETEAEAIQKRAAVKEKTNVFFSSPEASELEEANDCLRRGNRREAIIHLERFLGRGWIGELQ